MKNIKGRINKYHLLAFLIPIFIYAFLYLIFGAVYKNLFLHADAGFQFYGDFHYLKDVINGNNTFPYTFTSGIGGTMYGTFFYILSSPLNLIVLLFDNIMLAMFIITLIKLGLIGLTMYIYLSHKIENKKYALLFSLCYVLSSYVIIYDTNLMWLDALYLAPLVIYGVEKIVDDNKFLMYIVFVLFTLISNYYMGYIVAFYSFIYFIYYAYLNNKLTKKQVLRFIIIDILVILSISFILVPIYYESLNFSRHNKFKLINFVISDLFAGTINGVGNLDAPINTNLFLSYAGFLINILLISYLFDKSQNKKEKKAFILMLIIFLAPIIIVPLNYLWHLFTLPQGFVYRYSFLYLIFILPRLYKVLLEIKYNKVIKNMTLIYTVLLIWILVLNILTPYYYETMNNINIIVTLMILYINIYLIKKKNIKLLVYFLVFDLLLNITCIFINTRFTDVKYLNNNYSETKRIVENTDSNFRIGMLNTVAANDGLLFNYMGVTNFNSNINFRTIRVINRLYQGQTDKLAKEDSRLSIFYKRYDTVIDSILGIKYIGYDRINKNYELIDTYEANGEKYFMKNKYAFNLGFVVSDKIKDYKYHNDLSDTTNLVNAISGNYDDIFKLVDIIKVNDLEYQINELDKYNEIYLVYDGILDGNYEDETKKYPDIIVFENYSFYFNDKDDEGLNLKFKELNGDVKAYTYDLDKFIDLYNNLEQLKIDKNSGNYIKGTINVSHDNVLMFTIPYEQGWNIYIDSKKVNYYEVMDTFIAIDISEGEHVIELKYETPKLKISIIISLISFVLLILFGKSNILKENK